MQEEALLNSIKEGDSAAFFALVAIYKLKVLNTAYRFLLNKQDAEDIAQEVFIEVFHSVKQFRGDAGLSTWIYRITVSKCLDEIKKRKRKKRISSIGRMLNIDEVAGWLTGGYKPDSNILEKQQLAEMQEALDKLPENQRVAFTLSKIEGYSNKEIAAIMDTRVAMVETLISRAKKKISDRLLEILKKNQL